MKVVMAEYTEQSSVALLCVENIVVAFIVCFKNFGAGYTSVSHQTVYSYVDLFFFN